MYTSKINAVNVLKITQYNYWLLIKTHGSELQGQEEAGLRDERVSYLHIALL